MPCSAFGVKARVGRFGYRVVYRELVLRRGYPVNDRAQQGMREPDAGAEFDQAGRLGLRGRTGSDPEYFRRPPEQRDVTGRVDRGRQQEALGLGRKRLQAIAKRRF